MNLGRDGLGTLRWREVVVDGYDQNTLNKYMNIPKNRKSNRVSVITVHYIHEQKWNSETFFLAQSI